MNRFITTTKTKLNDSSQYSVILLASIPQERMVYSPPISLYNVDAKHILLELQYNTIRQVFPKADIYIVVGHYASQVISRCPSDIHIIENQKFTEFGECEELKLGLNATITDKIITISGNMIFNEQSLSQIKTLHSSILVDKNLVDDSGIGTISNQSRLENLAFGLDNKWCHISYFTGRELQYLKNIVNTKTKSSLCMFEAINCVTNKNGIIYTINHNNGFVQRIHK